MICRLFALLTIPGLAAVAMAQATATVPATAPASAPATAASAPATNSQPSGAAKDLTVTANDNGKTVKLGDKDGVAISIAGNPTTGFSWTVAKVDGDSLAQEGDIAYVADKVPAGVVGSGGTFVVHFRPVKSGTTTITLNYARPWEKDTPPAKTFTVTIVVD